MKRNDKVNTGLQKDYHLLNISGALFALRSEIFNL